MRQHASRFAEAVSLAAPPALRGYRQENLDRSPARTPAAQRFRTTMIDQFSASAPHCSARLAILLVFDPKGLTLAS
jgi:hypothetical protein